VEDLFPIRTGATSVFHTLVVGEEDNCLFGWGQSKSGQLGNLSKRGNTIPEPTEIPHSIEDNIVKVFCGVYHNILLTDTGDVYAFGDNSNSQLGISSLQPSKYRTPQIIPSLSGLGIDDIVIGTDYNFALSRKNGTVHAWGFAPDYQFGVAKNAVWQKPQLIIQVPPHLHLKEFSTGGYHSWMIITQKE